MVIVIGGKHRHSIFTDVDGAKYAVCHKADRMIGVMECWSNGQARLRVEDGG
jgi:hypothetical protein